jgi:hypothetical protein
MPYVAVLAESPLFINGASDFVKSISLHTSSFLFKNTGKFCPSFNGAFFPGKI